LKWVGQMLLKKYGIINKKNKSKKLQKIWDRLNDNKKISEWIQKKENEDIF
jgi:hypothetical protein